MKKTTAAAASLLIPLLGCSTPPVARLAPLPPPDFSFDLPPEPQMRGSICQLGSSCLELDSRPFEPCLVGARHCIDKMKPMAVQSPQPPPEPGVIITGLHRSE